jgi:hypothetical protein
LPTFQDFFARESGGALTRPPAQGDEGVCQPKLLRKRDPEKNQIQGPRWPMNPIVRRGDDAGLDCYCQPFGGRSINPFL